MEGKQNNGNDKVNSPADNNNGGEEKIKNPKAKKKKVNKVKPPKPVYNEFVYSPALQKAKPALSLIGFIGRMLIVFIGVLGITVFLTDAFKISINILALAAITLLITAVFCVMSLSKPLFWCGLGATVVGLAVWGAISGNPIALFMNCAGTFWNSMLDRLDRVGYKISSYLYLPVDTTTIFTDEQTAGYIFGGAVLLTIILAAIITPSIIKRTHILPVLILGSAVVTVVFTYNISSSNWGFVLILASFCGILTLKMYDSVYNRKKPVKDVKTNVTPQRSAITAAYGGIAGFATMALCFLLMLIPAMSCKDQWQTISFIDSKMEYARAVVSSVILGENADVDFGFIGNMDTMNSRSTVADDRTYTGTPMLQVYASYNMPMYLRSWVASTYSNDDNAWETVSSSKAAQYKSWFYNGFTPELITYNFYNFLNEKLTNVNSYTSYSNHIEDGFVTETIDVQNINSSGNLLFLAENYNPEYALMKFLSTDRDDAYSSDYSFYYEGIVTTSWFNLNKEYRFTAFIPSYRYESYADRLADNLEYYSIMKFYITQYSTLSSYDEQSAINAAIAQCDAAGIEYTSPTAIERYFALDEQGRGDFIYQYFTLPEYYEDFVYGEYLTVPSSSALKAAAQEVAKEYYESTGADLTTFTNVTIKENNGEQTFEYEYSYAGMLDESVRHGVVLAVVDYLDANYTYTLTPKDPKSSRLSALDAFLTDTKEGYCVQFATSAAMILREIGIPTRYVEGYLVNNLKYDKSEDRLAKYSQTIYDYSAHAWIDVYMGALGWMTYETTPEYYSDLYEPYESSSGEISTPEITTPETTAAVTTELETIAQDESKETEGGIKISAKTIMTVILIVIAAGAVALPVYLIFKQNERAVRAYEKRYEALNRAMRSKLSDDELRETAKTINDYIWQLHRVANCMPEVGELPDEYALRVDDTINASLFSFKDILSYMNREEFGYGMARWQLREEAEYMQVLWEKLYAGMTKFQRFKYRKLKRMI